MTNAKLETANERQMEMENDHKIEVDKLSKFYEEEKKLLRNVMEEARLEYLQQIENVKNYHLLVFLNFNLPINCFI